MKILISGGHITPALACIEYIKQNHKSDEIIFVGRKYSQDKLKQKAIEFKEVNKYKIPFIFFNAPKFEINSAFDLITKLILFIKSLWHAQQIINQHKPDVFLSFGGYLAVPIALIAKLKNIPILTHEQTQVIGRANSLLVKLANKTAISFAQTASYIKHKSKVVVTGNPIRKGVFLQAAKPNWFINNSAKPILFIMGGNQGSLILNNFVKQNLVVLVKNYAVVHQCGRDNDKYKYQAELKEKAQKVLSKNQQVYYPVTWLKEKELGWFYKNSKLVLSRAGANTLFELIKAKLPMILVPLAKTNLDEQYKNALWAVKQKIAVLILQKDFSLNIFLKAALKINQNYASYKQAFLNLKQDDNAAEKIYQILKSLVNNSHDS